MIDDVEGTAAKLQRALDVPAAELATVITARKDKRFAWLRRRVTEEQAEKVKALRLPGIGTDREPFRRYPNGPLAAHVLGFVGADEQGLAGVELQYDSKLGGTDGYKICTKDAAGRILSLVPNGYQPPRDGNNLVLTIDSFIQSFTEQNLQEAVDQFQAQTGVAIVMEPDTGQILALACRPAFDPNHYRDAPESALLNRVLVGPFEPGSIFKPLVMSAAVQEGLAHPGEIIYCHDGLYVTGSRRLRDAHPYGSLTLEQVIGKSSNIGMAMIGERMGNPLLWHYLTQYGLGAQDRRSTCRARTSASCCRSRGGRDSRPTPSPWARKSPSPRSRCSRPLTRSSTAAPLVAPTITRRSRPPTVPSSPTVASPGRSARSSSQPYPDYMTNVMLKGVVNEGTGSKARLARWQAVGKTGTAQIARRGGGGYEPDAYVGSFVCGAPAEQTTRQRGRNALPPEQTIAYYGGTVSGPAAGKILGAALDYLNVPDDAVPPPFDAKMLAASAGGGN